jgi:hypothetical protein
LSGWLYRYRFAPLVTRNQSAFPGCWLQVPSHRFSSLRKTLKISASRLRFFRYCFAPHTHRNQSAFPGCWLPCVLLTHFACFSALKGIVARVWVIRCSSALRSLLSSEKCKPIQAPLTLRACYFSSLRVASFVLTRSFAAPQTPTKGASLRQRLFIGGLPLLLVWRPLLFASGPNHSTTFRGQSGVCPSAPRPFAATALAHGAGGGACTLYVRWLPPHGSVATLTPFGEMLLTVAINLRFASEISSLRSR